MIRGLYTAATGLDAGMRNMDVISNNLANVGTVGFKREQTLFASLLDRTICRYGSDDRACYVGQMGAGVNFRLGARDLSPGTVLTSDSPLDIAFADAYDGTPESLTFLAVATPGGEQAYTRNGGLWLDGENFLRTTGGAYVLGHSPSGAPERLQIPAGAAAGLAIDDRGTLLSDEHPALGQLYLVRPAAGTRLEPLGDSLWFFEAEPTSDARLLPGHLEQANVQAVREMVHLITAMRHYETNSKMVQIQDATLEKAVNEIARF